MAPSNASLRTSEMIEWLLLTTPWELQAQVEDQLHHSGPYPANYPPRLCDWMECRELATERFVPAKLCLCSEHAQEHKYRWEHDPTYLS